MRLLTKLLVVVALVAGATAFFVISASDDDAAFVYTSNIPRPEPVAVSSRILVGGDVYWGRLFERRQPDNYAFPFSGLNTLDKTNYDAWVVNIECPITDEFVPFEAQWEAIQFNCRPEYLAEAAKWFDVASLANNHTDNVRGEEGLNTTRQHLEQSGIQYFGHYEPGVLEDLCEIVSIDASLIYDDGIEEALSLPIAMCGYHGVFRQFSDAEIEYLARYAERFITFVMPHAGAEYKASSDPLREAAYRKMIDAGADAIFGNHPHWVQNTEVYQKKLIVYSMGNFIFDQEFNTEVTRSAVIEADITLQHSEQLTEYLQALSECADFKDDCLTTAREQGFKKPAFTITYDAIATRTTDLVTKRDNTSAGQSELKTRMNWAETLAELE